MRIRPKEDGTPTNERPFEATNGDRSLQMSDSPKTATNEQPSEETRSYGRELQKGPRQRPPKRTTVRRRGQPSAEEDNRRGQPKIGRCQTDAEQPSIGTDAEQPSIGTDAEQPSIGTAL